MNIIVGIIAISLILFILHALSMSIEGKSLLESVSDFGKEIYKIINEIKYDRKKNKLR